MDRVGQFVTSDMGSWGHEDKGVMGVMGTRGHRVLSTVTMRPQC